MPGSRTVSATGRVETAPVAIPAPSTASFVRVTTTSGGGVDEPSVGADDGALAGPDGAPAVPDSFAGVWPARDGPARISRYVPAAPMSSIETTAAAAAPGLRFTRRCPVMASLQAPASAPCVLHKPSAVCR